MSDIAERKPSPETSDIEAAWELISAISSDYTEL